MPHRQHATSQKSQKNRQSSLHDVFYRPSSPQSPVLCARQKKFRCAIHISQRPLSQQKTPPIVPTITGPTIFIVPQNHPYTTRPTPTPCATKQAMRLYIIRHSHACARHKRRGCAPPYSVLDTKYYKLFRTLCYSRNFFQLCCRGFCNIFQVCFQRTGLVRIEFFRHNCRATIGTF